MADTGNETMELDPVTVLHAEDNPAWTTELERLTEEHQRRVCPTWTVGDNSLGQRTAEHMASNDLTAEGLGRATTSDDLYRLWRS